MSSDRDNSYNDALAIFADFERFGRFVKTIQVLHDKITKDRRWISYTVSKLYEASMQEFLRILEDEKNNNKDFSLLCWRTRNIIEINLWTIYCTKSEDNLRKLFEDTSRDSYDLAKKAVDVIKQLDPEGLFKVQEWKENQEAKAVEDDIDISESYIEFRDIAKEIGYWDTFKVMNKFLSKHSHSTAMKMMTRLSDEGFHDLKGQLRNMSGFYFRHNVEMLEEFLYFRIKLNSVD